MDHESLSGWQEYYSEGSAFLNRMKSGAARGRLSPEVLHGLASMANEKLLVSLLMHNGVMPEGHTFFNLVSAAGQFVRIGEDLRKELLRMDEMVPLCSLDPVPWQPIPVDAVGTFIRTTERVHALVNDAIRGKEAAG